MPGFLRKKATLSRRISARLRDPKQPSSSDFVSPSDQCSSDVPPSLPPLLLSTSFADPDPEPRAPSALPPAASPPVLSLPTPAPEYLLDDAWDPWKAYVNAPRLAPPSVPRSNPVSGSNDSIVICNSTAVSRPVATEQGWRQKSDGQLPSCPKDIHPKSDALDNESHAQQHHSSCSLDRPLHPTAVVRGQMAPASNFDFEESLSAANVTSVVNQFRSYPPPIRHHPSPAPPSQDSRIAIQHPRSSILHSPHTAPQKPRSSSSLSSSSHHTDATRRTNGSYRSSTSASSLHPEVIDVNRRLDPACNGSPLDHNPSPFASRTSRPSTPNLRTHRTTTVPPTSYPDHSRTLTRQTSTSSLASNPPPMLYDVLRSGTPEARSLRRGPLIFTAMSSPQQPPLPFTKAPAATNRNTSVHNPYPSPLLEYAPLDASPPSRRNGSISSIFRGAPRLDARSQDGLVSPTLHSAELPSLAHKSSRTSLRHVAVEHTASTVTRGDTNEHARPRVLTKARPTTPQKQGTAPYHKVLPEPSDPSLLDDDPFARAEGVKMLKPRTRSSSRASASLRVSKEDVSSSEDGQGKVPGTPSVPKAPLSSVSCDDAPIPPGTPPPSAPEKSLPTPVTPEDYKTARQQRRGRWLEKAPPPAVADVVAKQLTEVEEEQPREPTPPPTYFPIMDFMSDTNLFPLLLSYLSYSEWLSLYSASRQVRELFQNRMLRELVLVRYLSTVGYSKWSYEWAEMLPLSLKDLHDYLRGVAMPTHEYARLSAAYLQPPTVNQDAATTSGTPDILALALTTRAYTRVVLRLRAQAESEDRYIKMQASAELSQTTSTSRPGTRQYSVSSRAPSPTSSYSHSRNHSHGKNDRSPSSSSPGVPKFGSPLYRLGRAPVLRVFVPSPEGDWLSDASVVECEAELKRSGVLKLLRVGDVVWDVAVGDEGNLGRLIWDGSYLVDLDYRYSRMGELSPYLHSLAFSPSYFHRVIRIGGSATHNPHCNPIVYIDVSPWGHEIATNLQLLQDRARTETPHGALHDVVRWVHRSSFIIRPSVPPSQGRAHSRSRTVRIPIPNVEGLYIDGGWYGKVVIEAEGTNEGLANLQARCGPGVFPPRAETLATKIRNAKEKENKRVWRVLREKSRPGEIWLRVVEVKERIM